MSLPGASSQTSGMSSIIPPSGKIISSINDESPADNNEYRINITEPEAIGDEQQEKSTMIDSIMSTSIGPSACTSILAPLYWYMKIFGMNYSYSRRKYRLPFLFYNVIILAYQIGYTIRVFVALVTATTWSINIVFIMSLIDFCYFFMGAFSSSILLLLQSRLTEIHSAVAKELPIGHQLYQHHYLYRLSMLQAIIIFVMSAINMIAVALIRFNVVSIPGFQNVPVLISHALPYILLDIYIIFLTQSAIMLVPALFTVLCISIKQIIIELSNELISIQSKCEFSQFRRRYQAIFDAFELIERRFATTILMSFSVAVPLTCFILYALARGGTGDGWLSVVVLLVWTADCIVVMLYYCVPAAILGEQKERLFNSVLRMFYVKYEQSTDIFIYTKLHFFTYEVSMRRLQISPHKFFDLDKVMLLTMFSAILTYFIILLQFSDQSVAVSSALSSNITAGL